MAHGIAERKLPGIALVVAIAAVTVGGLVSQVSATTYTLTDLTSSLSIDDSGSGTFDWTLDGVDQLFQQWFWYRIGDTDAEAPITGLGLVSAEQYGSNKLELIYSDGQLKVDVFYKLTGDNLGLTSDVVETVTVTNVSGSAMDLHFFQYTDLDLAGTYEDDYGRLANPNTVNQWDPIGLMASETVATPPADHHELAFFSQTLDKLQDGVASNLNDMPALGVALGPGDVTWAFQWDKTLSAGQTLIISKDKQLNVVPEPATMFCVVMGLSGLAGYIRRRRMA